MPPPFNLIIIDIFRHCRFINPAFMEEENFPKKPDIVESHITKNGKHEKKEVEDEFVDDGHAKDDSSTDVLKLQMYDEIVQRFGPDEQFSKMLRSQGTLDRLKSNNSNDLILSSNRSTSENDEAVENDKPSNNGKVEVLLMSQVPETHRSSYRSLIISPNNF